MAYHDLSLSLGEIHMSGHDSTVATTEFKAVVDSIQGDGRPVPLVTATAIVTTTATTTANRKPTSATDFAKANGNEPLSSPEQEEL